MLIAQGIWAFCSLIDKIVISKGHIRSPFVYIVLNGVTNIFLIFLLPFTSFEPLKFTDFLIVLFAGAAHSTAVTLYYKAVQYDEISRIKVMNQLSPVFVLILSILFLGEILTKIHFIGFILLLGAGMMVSYRNGKKSFMLSKAFYYMLAAAFVDAFGIIAEKHILNVTSFWNAFLWLRLASFVSLAVLLVPSVRNDFISTFKGMKTRIKQLLGFKMIIDFLAFIFAVYALFKGPASLVTVLSSSVGPLFMFLIALLFSIYLPKIVKEAAGKKIILIKISAIALIIAGIVFVNM